MQGGALRRAQYHSCGLGLCHSEQVRQGALRDLCPRGAAAAAHSLPTGTQMSIYLRAPPPLPHRVATILPQNIADVSQMQRKIISPGLITKFVILIDVSVGLLKPLLKSSISHLTATPPPHPLPICRAWPIWYGRMREQGQRQPNRWSTSLTKWRSRQLSAGVHLTPSTLLTWHGLSRRCTLPYTQVWGRYHVLENLNIVIGFLP